jgi:patatin-like phospholipase/acyl hydrolase
MLRKILSIDGGGIRGIIPALVLRKMERWTGKPVSAMFDLIAGTSTGGILALGLSKSGAGGRPQFAAEDLAVLYEQHGQRIFGRPIWRRFLPIGNLLDEKYQAGGIEQVLEEYFGDERLKNALKPVLITSYEIERRVPFFFRSHKALTDPAYDFPMRLVARATSAAPTYFEPLRIETGGATGYYALVDGGVFANNPALCALVEAQRLYPGDEYLMVSLGTGTLTRPLPYEKVRRWGVGQWAKPVLDIAFDGLSSTVDFQLRSLLGPKRYFRFQATLDPSQERMDNAARGNMRGLKLLAEWMMRDRERELELACGAVVGETACP